MTRADIEAKVKRLMQRMMDDARRQSVTAMIADGLDDDEIDEWLDVAGVHNEQVLGDGRAQLARAYSTPQSARRWPSPKPIVIAEGAQRTGATPRRLAATPSSMTT